MNFFNFLKCQKNEQMLTEGELSMVEDSDRVRELQDRIGDLKAEVFEIEIAQLTLVYQPIES